MTKSLKPYVVVATKGRPNDVAVVHSALQGQTVSPERIIFVGTEPNDFGAANSENANANTEFLISERPGLTIQRNVGINRVLEIQKNCDNFVIVYFDDDFRPGKNWLKHAVKSFSDPDIAGITGSIIADGAIGSGISEDTAGKYLRDEMQPDKKHWIAKFHDLEIDSAYGCNMAFSAEVSRNVRFDETLPAYGWLEDRDYSVSARQYGSLQCLSLCRGVHLGTKSGRVPGKKFGYSQISNPLYLKRKGTMGWKDVLILMPRNMLINHLKILFPEPWVDRRGRALGNWIAIVDLLRRRLSPTRINEL